MRKTNMFGILEKTFRDGLLQPLQVLVNEALLFEEHDYGCLCDI